MYKVSAEKNSRLLSPHVSSGPAVVRWLLPSWHNGGGQLFVQVTWFKGSSPGAFPRLHRGNTTVSFFCMSQKEADFSIICVTITATWHVLIFCSLLREIQRSRGRRSWPQGMSQLYPEGSSCGFSLWENLPKLNFHSAQSSDTVNTAMCMNIHRFQRAKSTDSSLVSDKVKYFPGRGKKTLTPILSMSAEEKAQNSQIRNSLRKQPPRKKGVYPLKTYSLIDKNGSVRLARQRVFSAELGSGRSLINSIYRQPLRAPLSADNPWKSISELVSEKWLFHTPHYCFTPQKSVFPRRSQIETKMLKTSYDPDKE